MGAKIIDCDTITAGKPSTVFALGVSYLYFDLLVKWVNLDVFSPEPFDVLPLRLISKMVLVLVLVGYLCTLVNAKQRLM